MSENFFNFFQSEAPKSKTKQRETPETKKVKRESVGARDTLVQDSIGRRVEQLIGKEGIKVIQRYFNEEENGIYGRQLSQKVAQFQRENGLGVDGYAGPKTLEKIQGKMARGFFETLFGRQESAPKTLQQAKTQYNEKMEREKSSISALGSRTQSVEKVPANITEANKEFVEAVAPYGWKQIAFEFASRLNSNELLSQETPLILVDSNSRSGTKAPCIYLYKGKVQRYTVTLGFGGTTLESQRKQGDGKTPVKMIHRFNQVKIGRSAEESTANSADNRGVVSASLQSDYSSRNGYRYFHGLPDGLDYTLGCVGFNKEEIRPIAQDVRTALSNKHQAYGYVS